MSEMRCEKTYIIYGGGEAERFIFCNLDILQNIKFCIDKYRKEFHKIPICKLNEANLTGEYIIVAAGDENR